jgi:ribosomal protein S12 methylthiotransferase
VPPSATLEVLGSDPLANTPTNVLPAAEPARLKVGFVSLGCPKNLVDSEVMMGMLHHGGAQLTPAAEDADIIVVNTCSFIDSAKQESVNTILEMAKHKIAAGGRARKLIVAGCLVERYRDDIIANIPEVDAVVGTGELDAILAAAGLTSTGHAVDASNPFTILTTTQISRAESAVNQHSRPESTGTQLQHEAEHPSTNLSSRPERSAVERPASSGAPLPSNAAPSEASTLNPGPSTTSRPEGDLREQQGRFSRADWHGAAAALPTYLADEYTPRILSTPRASAYIKIAEGCDHPCTFCIIPQLRGKFRSRRIGSIMAEAQNLIAQGVREITLIGQDTTCYGEDLGLTDGLAQLLEGLAGLEGMRWLRFLYTYPNKVTTRLLETMAKHDNIAKYLDVPLQHASGPLLKSMKRGGNAEIFLKLIDKARATVPGIVIRTSFIVGFPGETNEDFQVLCDFVQAAQIDWLGVFSYSDEEGAAAFNFAPETKVPKRTIETRRRKIMRLQQKISIRKKAEWIGREVDLLVEGESEETELLWQGRTILHAPEIDGKVLINDFGPHEQLVPGTFYRAEITESHDYDLVARIIE